MQTTQLTGGRGWLDAAAAASVHRIDRALGHLLDINEAGRTWAQQMVFWETYQREGAPIALHPDTPSVHQLGNAIDTDDSDRVALLNEHGWFQTVYRWVNGKYTLVEPWHFEYDASRDQHINDPEEDDMPLDADRDYAAFAQMLQRALKFDARPLGVGADAKLGPTVFEQIDRIPARVWDTDITAQDADGYPLNEQGERAKAGEKRRTYKAWGYLASAVAQLSAIRNKDAKG